MEDRGEFRWGGHHGVREGLRVRRCEKEVECMKHFIAKEVEGAGGRTMEGDISHVHEGELSDGKRECMEVSSAGKEGNREVAISKELVLKHRHSEDTEVGCSVIEGPSQCLGGDNNIIL